MAMLQHSAIEEGIYPIQRSLRFRSSASAYLSRTPASAGNRKTWTWSGFVKLGSMGQQCLFFGDALANSYCVINFQSDSTLRIFNNNAGTTTVNLGTSQVFRDPSAFYHIIVTADTTQATANNRIKVFVNGSQVTSFSTATYPSQNSDLNGINQAVGHGICQSIVSLGNFDGYLAEVNFIDGQALTPSSFGQTDPSTGVWVAKKYTGTYGTNGFYLDFKDNSTTTALATDKSGNGNNWTPNNISLTAGATYDSMTDVPTLTSATAANYCVLNPLNGDINGAYSIYGGNLYCFHGTDGSYTHAVTGTMSVNSGKWYWEVSGSYYVGITAFTEKPLNDNYYNSTLSYSYVFNGNKSQGATATAYGATYNTTTDIIGVALDMDAGTITFYKNGVSQGTAYTGLSGYFTPFSLGWSSLTSIYNFGQRPFSYTAPANYKTLNTFNLPDPTIKKPNLYMDVATWSGTSTSQTITNSGFQPDLVWTKNRNGTNPNLLNDSVRGITAYLQSNATNAEATDATSFTSFNSNGFTLGANTNGGWNTSGQTYVGWQWKESTTSGFDIVTYTGNGSGQTISHSLGVAPKMMIIKSRSNGVYGWSVYHEATGNTKYLILNQTDAASTNSGFWNNTSPTSTNFTIGTNIWVSGNTYTYVAYLFAEIAGFSKFGSYTGNGSTDGPFVYCGFRPKFILVKRTDTTGNWQMLDTTRLGYNASNYSLFSNLSNAESYNVVTDILSNGIKMRDTATDINASGGTYIFAAFAENPLKYSNAR